MPRLIIIDPAAFQRRILSLLARDCGYEETAEAASLFELDPPPAADDVVIMDAASFAGDARGAVVTATAAHDDLLAAKIEAGAATFLVKPFTKPGFQRALADLALDGRALPRTGKSDSPEVL